MRILTDIDGCVLDWFSGFKKYVEKLGVPQKCAEPTDWNLDTWLDHRNISGLVEEYNNTAAFSELNPYQDAINIIPPLYFSEGYDFHAITASSKSNASKNLRMVNLDIRFGWIFGTGKVSFTEPGHSKAEILKAFEPTIWIEDRPKAALEGVEAGHTCLLLDRNYNREFSHDKVTRVKDWYEISDFIRAFDFPRSVQE